MTHEIDADVIIPVDKVLRGAKDCSVICLMGIKPDGSFYVASSHSGEQSIKLTKEFIRRWYKDGFGGENA